MTPAEHQVEAQRILDEVNEIPRTFHEMIPEGSDLADPGIVKAAELTASMIHLGLLEAQVHATLATVFPDGDSVDRETIANRLEDQIRPLLGTKTDGGGYDCCGCSITDVLLDHAIAIVRGER